SASLGGKSPPTMPLIPAIRPLKNISSTTENPIRAPPITAERNGCMNSPPFSRASILRIEAWGEDGNHASPSESILLQKVSSERASPLWAMKKGLLLPHANESAVSIQQEKFSAMMFRQLFDQTSGTYSYLLASRAGGEALIIDPVLEKA